jgi:hypothetical protein
MHVLLLEELIFLSLTRNMKNSINIYIFKYVYYESILYIQSNDTDYCTS